MNPRDTFQVELMMSPCRRLQFNLSDMYPVPRLGIGYLASYLKKNGYEQVAIRDIIAEHEWIPEILARYEHAGYPDLLGLGTTVLSVREAFEIATAIKAKNPSTAITVGGPGIKFKPQALADFGKDVDYFVYGEGEEALYQIAEMVRGENVDIHDIPNLIWRDGNTAVKNKEGHFIDLNQNTVDYAALPMKRYQLHPPMGAFPPATMMETTRGCSFPCDFCCLSMPVRYKSPEQVEKEIRNLQKDFGIKEVHFVDPTFTLHRERAEELCDHIKTLGIKWSCKTRVDLMPEKLVHKMAESGCYLVAFGVESGDELILKNLQKKAAAESAVETFARCRKHKIRTTAYLLVANPGETDETVQTNIDFVKKLHPDYVLYDILQVDPGNPLTWKMIRQGLFTEDDLNRYYMTDEHTRLHEISVCGHESETAKAWIKKASAAFYLRPSYFAERIIDLRSIQDAANLGSGGFTFLKDLFSIGKLWNK